MHEPSYIAGLVDGHYLEHTGRELRLRYSISWQLVEQIADFLDGSWTARRRGSNKAVRMFIIRFQPSEQWTQLAEISQAIKQRDIEP
jgi:hypothetical protein